jgi:hypothetical protein
MEGSIVSIVIGACIRALPEVMKLVNKLIDNAHELALLKNSKRIDNNKIESKVVMNDAPLDMEFLKTLVKVQSKKTGIFIVDFMNALVKSYVTYALLTLYVGIKIWFIRHYPDSELIENGLKEIWTNTDMDLLCGILGFWFLGRVIDNNNTRR